MTEGEVIKRTEGLSDEQAKVVICALVGHSRIQTYCFGYFNCARCGEQVGDNLGSTYDGNKSVIVDHDCAICRANFASLDWKHKLLTPEPFKAEASVSSD